MAGISNVESGMEGEGVVFVGFGFDVRCWGAWDGENSKSGMLECRSVWVGYVGLRIEGDAMFEW